MPPIVFYYKLVYSELWHYKELRGRLVEIEGQKQIEKRIREGFEYATKQEEAVYNRNLKRKVNPPSKEGGIFLGVILIDLMGTEKVRSL